MTSNQTGKSGQPAPRDVLELTAQEASGVISQVVAALTLWFDGDCPAAVEAAMECAPGAMLGMLAALVGILSNVTDTPRSVVLQAFGIEAAVGMTEEDVREAERIIGLEPEG